MTDIDRLTAVVAIGFVLLIGRLPEQDCSKWGLSRLTLDLGISFILTIVLFRLVLSAFHVM